MCRSSRLSARAAGLVVVAAVAVFAAACSSSTSTSSTATTSGGSSGRTLKVGADQDYKTIQAAVDAAKAGDMVLISPGVYKESVTVEKENLVIRGLDRNKVILDGEYQKDNGIKVLSDGVAVENLTARSYKGNGVFFTGDYDSQYVLKGYRASYVSVINNGDYGIYAFNATKGQFDHVYGSGQPDSAYYIGQCTPCDAVVTDAVAENNFLGYSGTNSTGVSIVNSIWRWNRIGISPQSQDGEKNAPNDGGLIAGNLVYDNNNPNTPQRDPKLAVAYGTGIVNPGTNNYTITKNRVEGNKKAGIVIILWPFGKTFDPNNNKVTDNIATGAERYGDLVLALFDTSGGTLGNCFSGNQFATSRPKDIETVAPCSGTGQSGFEAVDASVLAEGAPDPIDYKAIPMPGDQPTMPDAATAPAVNAGGSWKPIAVDPATIKVPTMDLGTSTPGTSSETVSGLPKATTTTKASTPTSAG
ncbi:MAG: right-handed parallel beta-helix repeat-containing protein [Acidimicrobiales bacterium]